MPPCWTSHPLLRPLLTRVPTPAAPRKERGQGFPECRAVGQLQLRAPRGMPRLAETLDVAAAEPGVGGKQSCQRREVPWVVSL